jgi:hypothetical protein
MAPVSPETVRLVVLVVAIPTVFGLILLVAWWRDRSPDVPRELSEPPEEIHPVDLAYQWSSFNGHVSPKTAYRAALLQLARTGAIELVAVGTVSDPEDFVLRLLRRPGPGIDADLTDFLFPRGDETISLNELRVRGVGVDRMKRWWSDVAERGRTVVTRTLTGTYRLEVWASFVLGMFAVPIVIGSVDPNAFSSGDDPLVGLAYLEGMAGWAIAALVLPTHLEPTLRARFARWRAFRRYLMRFSSLRDAPAQAVIVWEDYVGYAVALGAGRVVQREIRGLGPWRTLPSPWPGAPHGVDGWTWLTRFHGWAPRRPPP